MSVLTQLLDVGFISLTCEVFGVSYKDERLVVAKTQYKQLETEREGGLEILVGRMFRRDRCSQLARDDSAKKTSNLWFSLMYSL